MSSLISQNAFQVIDSRPVTSSRIVANYFGKRHEDVVRSIRSIISKKPELQASRNFAEWSEEVEIGSGAKRTVVCYWMDRKGFSILAMGFTGAKALDFKCEFYDQFERMEKQLHPQCPVVVHQKAIRHPINREQQNAIIGAINTKAYEACVPKSYVYASLKSFFKVDKYTDIKADDFDLAIGFIKRLNYGNSQKSLPAPESPKTLSDRELQAIQRLHRFHADPFWRDCAKQAIKVLQAADSRFAGRFYDLITEPTIAWCTLERVLDRNGIKHSY